MEQLEFEINHKTVQFLHSKESKTLVLIHDEKDKGMEVYKECEQIGCADVSIATISGMSWEDDLSPWEAPAAFKKGRAFSGKADLYIKELLEEILVEIKQRAEVTFEQIVLAGYSLAGLFALYTAYQTNEFDGIISASGSMWYPNFMDYVQNNEISKQVKYVYLSVGDKEAMTKNPVMMTVEENTRRIEAYLKEQGIGTIFELNRGGHFVDDAKRLAKGICWMTEQKR